MEIALVLLVIAVIFVVRTFKIVPQQEAWVVERLGKYDRTLTPGLKFLIPFIERVAYKHSLKEVPLDVPSQVCITKDNTQLQVDGILYFQVTDPMRASYGSSDYIVAITQLAQTTLRSVIGRMELDKTFEERDAINASVVQSLDEAALNWGVKVLRYEIKDLTPPAEILRAMQAQITAEREKRALIAASEGRRQEQINIATGEREAFIARSEGEKQAEINKAQGEAAAIVAVAEATAQAIRQVADAIRAPGGEQAVQLKVAERAVEAYGQLAQTNNTMIVPGNMTEVAGLIGTAMALTLVTMVIATVLHAVTNHQVDAVLALILMVGGVIGAQFGARAGQRIRGEQLRLLLGLLILAVGIRFAVELTIRPDELYTIRDLGADG